MESVLLSAMVAGYGTLRWIVSPDAAMASARDKRQKDGQALPDRFCGSEAVIHLSSEWSPSKTAIPPKFFFDAQRAGRFYEQGEAV